jgi:hypothetical protein
MPAPEILAAERLDGEDLRKHALGQVEALLKVPA